MASASDTLKIPFIEGDGTGPDIWRASVRVFDAAVERAYGGRRHVEWIEVLAGEKAFTKTGNWLPEETLDAFRRALRRHQGTADDAGWWRHSLTQRRAAPGARPLRLSSARSLLQGLDTPVKRPDLVDMVIFRENTEDIYAGIEFRDGTPENRRVQGIVREGISQALQEDSVSRRRAVLASNRSRAKAASG